MKKIFFIIILSTFNAGTVPLDSLVANGKMLEHRATHISGFLPQTKYVPVIPLVPLKEKSIQEEKSVSVPLSQNNVNNDLTIDLLNRVTNTEVELAKVTVILESLQKQSESHTNSSDFNLKLIELLLGFVGTIIVSLIGMWFQDRKKVKK
jgi:hypothetical protein